MDIAVSAVGGLTMDEISGGDARSDGIAQFRKLDWRDTTLRHMRCKGGAMSFTMTEHVPGTAADSVELVAVAITGLTYLSVNLAAYRDGRYGAFEKPVTLGSAEGATQILEFEGRMLQNPFSTTGGDYFWVAIDFAAANVEVKRSGRFVSAASAGSTLDRN
jgi:hypothetical protein